MKIIIIKHGAFGVFEESSILEIGGFRFVSKKEKTAGWEEGEGLKSLQCGLFFI